MSRNRPLQPGERIVDHPANDLYLACRLGDLPKESILTLAWMSRMETIERETREMLNRLLSYYSWRKGKEGGIDHTKDLPRMKPIDEVESRPLPPAESSDQMSSPLKVNSPTGKGRSNGEDGDNVHSRPMSVASSTDSAMSISRPSSPVGPPTVNGSSNRKVQPTRSNSPSRSCSLRIDDDLEAMATGELENNQLDDVIMWNEAVRPSSTSSSSSSRKRLLSATATESSNQASPRDGTATETSSSLSSPAAVEFDREKLIRELAAARELLLQKKKEQDERLERLKMTVQATPSCPPVQAGPANFANMPPPSTSYQNWPYPFGHGPPLHPGQFDPTWRCRFCNMTDHPSMYCHHYDTSEKRYKRINLLGLCVHCLEKFHVLKCGGKEHREKLCEACFSHPQHMALCKRLFS